METVSKDVKNWVAKAVYIFVVLPLCIKTGNQVRNQLNWTQFLALSKLSPPPCINRKPRSKLIGVPKDALLSLCSLLSFLLLKAFSPVLILLPPSFIFICSFQSSSYFLTQEQKLVSAQACWPGEEECSVPRTQDGQAQALTQAGRWQAAGLKLGRLQHLARRGWKALRMLAHHTLAEAHWFALLPIIFQMGKWRHNHTQCGCRVAGSQGAL